MRAASSRPPRPPPAAVREAPAMSDDGLALLSVTAYGFLAGEHRSTTRFVNADGAVYLYTAIR